jgi:membrane fusion protein (multidrug efflux system)
MHSEAVIHPPKPRRVGLFLGVAAIAAIGAAGYGVSSRFAAERQVATWSNDQAPQTVKIVRPERGPAETQVVLPGTVSAFNSSSLYARASGYITAWKYDIGAHVKKGDVLATISAPDLDQQYEEAKAQLVQLQAAVDQAKANADLGKVTDQRTSQLVKQGWTSAQQGDTDHLTSAARVAALAVANANVTAQEAAVNRLKELTQFEEIKAPFDGVVTARSIDIGDLVAAGGNTGRALFGVADIHRMRIYVNVPQAFLEEMKPGIKATLDLPGRPETFDAELVSTSNSLAESSRTALIELQVDNADGKLWPGAFTEVHFHIPSDPNTLRVPATALVFGPKGMRVATVDASGKVDMKTVTVGRNLGDHVEIQSGAALTDRLVDNPQESLRDGDVVQVASDDSKAPAVAVSSPVVNGVRKD